MLIISLILSVPTIHQVTASPQGLSVNSYLVEGAQGVVVIDTALTVSDSKVLQARVASLGKPLLGILLTHGHPDHYNGAVYLNEGKRVPIYATSSVTQVITEWDARKAQQWQPVFKEEWPTQRVFPDHSVKDGTRVSLGDLVFVVHDLGPAESHADSYWELLGSERVAFIGDQVLAGSHAYTADGHTGQWIKTLDALALALKGAKHVYPGHGAAGDPALLQWQKRYLVKYRKEVDALRAGGDKLSESQKQSLVAVMKAAYPKETNEFMIALGADAVAAELAHAAGK